MIKGAPQLALKSNIDMAGGGMIADLDIHDQNIRQHEQKKKANATMAQMNESMMTTNMNGLSNFDMTRGTMRGTETGSEYQEAMVPTAKRQKDKEEYERRRQEEEEMKRILDEERQKQLDQWGGVEDNLQAIPIQRILEYKMKQKLQNQSETMSNTMRAADNFNQPAISGQTFMSTTMTSQLNGYQASNNNAQ